MHALNNQKGIFLDRDGTLIYDKHYLGNPAEVEVCPGAETFIKELKQQDYHLFLFTNQSGINRGYFTLKDVLACNARMLELLHWDHTPFTETCICPEKPEEPSLYRKPSPQFILEMISQYKLLPQECWMIGDTIRDLQTGINAGIQVAWVETGKPQTTELKAFLKNHDVPTSKDLTGLLPYILRSSSNLD